MINFDILKQKILEFDKELKIYELNNSQIVFEERVLLNCFYCSNYDKKWTCPPRIPQLDYQKIFKEYKNITSIIYQLEVDKDNFETLRNKSTNKIHSALLFAEKFLWNNNYPLSLSFIGGSCKLCKNGCSLDKCKNKSASRIPVEALGINVVETLKNINIDVVFPTDCNLLRCGMILW